MPNFQPQTTTQAIVGKLLGGTSDAAKKVSRGYTYIDGSLIPNALSPIIAKAIRAGRIVRPGVGINEQFVASIDPKSVNKVTVQLQTNMGVRARTIKADFAAGTPGNDGMINKNDKLIPSTSPLDVPVLQLEDQPLFFPQMQMQTMLFDEVAVTVANYMDNVTNGIDSYHMAKALSYAMYRGASEADDPTDITDYDNIITIDEAHAYDDLYMVRKINDINAKLANGDSLLQLMSFSGPREIAARPELLGWLKTPKTGFILNSDISTKLFYEPNYDTTEAERVGTQHRGSIQGYDLQEAPQGVWSLVEKWLGLAEGDLSGVYGIIFTPQAYAGAGVGKKEMTMLQSSQYDGVVAFPYIKYGGTAYRKMIIIASESWTIPAKLQNVNYPSPVLAPTQWYEDGLEPIQKVIYDASGQPVGVETIANIVKANNLLCEVTFAIKNATGTNITAASLVITNGSKVTPFVNNGDGTYTFTCKQGDTPSVVVSATGYTSQTITLTKANTKYSAYKKDITLVATVTYTLAYNSNTGTGTMTDTQSPYNTGDIATVLANAFEAPSGYKFSKFNTAADGNGTDYNPGETITMSANVTLYAIWVLSE